MSARTVSLGGLIWASAAHTTIPTTPIAGEPYRNTAFAIADAANGWRYYRVADSADFNQFVFLMSTVLNDVEQQGLLKWSNLTDYPLLGICRDPDNDLFYEAIAVSGPNNGGAKQPSLNIGTYWKKANFGASNEGYSVRFITGNITAENNELVYCLNGSLTVTLPSTPSNGNKVKVSSGGSASAVNQVTVAGSEIQEAGNTAIIISTPFTTVEFIWNTSLSRWVLGEICYPVTQ